MVGWLRNCLSIPGSRVQILGLRVAANIGQWIPANDELITEFGKGSKNPGYKDGKSMAWIWLLSNA
jgi:hypothetical protein